ncbi:MAG: hypothetical protein PHS57_04355 [Alphaproteobacteria bacterium]|nr:hypothetical protein [Alphaproteobacteria bacterium]
MIAREHFSFFQWISAKSKFSYQKKETKFSTNITLKNKKIFFLQSLFDVPYSPHNLLERQRCSAKGLGARFVVRVYLFFRPGLKPAQRNFGPWFFGAHSRQV